ncbi:MAG: sugar transferase [candidate division Zixibacteria bacterium]|nr:sugar transferase [candidate division Zixibacteria bacterium]
MLRDHIEGVRKLLLFTYLIVISLSFKASLFIESLIETGNLESGFYNNLLISVILIWGLVLWYHRDCYFFRLKSNLETLKPITKASIKASTIFLGFIYFSGYNVQSQFQIVLFLLVSFLALSLLQLFVNVSLHYFRKRGYNYQTIVIVGKNDKAKEFANKILSNAHWGFKIIGYVDCGIDSGNGSDKMRSRLNNISEIGMLDDLPDIIKSHQVDWVVFALENDKLKFIESTVDDCQIMGTRVAILANLYPPKYAEMRAADFFEYPILLYDNTKQSGSYHFVKSIIDRIGAAAGLILISPFLLFASIAIKIFSKGSILFKQERLGLNGKKFTMYKFRTMVPNAEKLKANLEEYNEMSGPVFKIKDDPRITPVGRLLRKTSIDELPQIFNVLKGDMSFVGPRPPLLKEVKQYDPWQRRRLSIKPGITCLWQVGGRNNVNFDNWMKLDLEYIDNRSIWLDTKILARTIPAVFNGKGAS